VPSRIDRLVLSRAPRRAPLLLVLPVGAAAAGSALLPAPSGLLPSLLAAVLAGLWCGRLGRLVVPLLAGLALVPVSAAVPAPPQLAAGGAAGLALLACTHLVSRCAAISAAAAMSAVQAAVAREDDVRAAAQSQQELAGQLHYWSTHDALTGVLNRTAFVRLVDSTLAAGHPVGVLVVSVAGFTSVNEQLGDGFGDAALTELARRLSGTARGGDLIARLGGDSFAVLLSGLQEQAAVAVGARMLQALEEPVIVDEDAAVLRTRSGVAVVAGGATLGGRELLRAAEAAARTATIGQPPVVVTGETPAVAPADSGLTEADLARGIADRELFLLYQPLVCGVTGRITHVEALVRWRHPDHGLVPPDSFIGLAERTGLILPLGLQVLELACAQLAAWAQTAPQLTVAVNVSARQLVEPGFVEDVRKVLWGSRVDPSRVVLELTESLLVDDSDAAVAVLWQLRGLGVRLALDDFGTGYSSLARLGDLPLDEMKIDKSFVDRLGALPRDSATLVTAAVAMGHGLGLQVVAEGVETATQAAFLREVGCDLLQGYLMGRPQPADEVTAQLGVALLPPAGASAIPDPRAEQDRVVVPGVMPSMDQRQR
jgi:diguanylate cyclase (GGDEF)-like protein